jgi:DNA mismatch endonuclease (patch repair protein)
VPPLDRRSRVDIVFTRLQLAVYIDGCFWHGCPEHATYPKTNAEYWLPKLARNVERDSDAVATLHSRGWHVMRFWEHESPELVVAQITAKVLALRSESPGK